MPTIRHSVLTNFGEGQNTDLSERLLNMFRNGNERSKNGFRERYPTCGCCVIRRSLLGTYLDDRPDEFDDLLLLNSELIVPRQGSESRKEGSTRRRGTLTDLTMYQSIGCSLSFSTDSMSMSACRISRYVIARQYLVHRSPRHGKTLHCKM